MKKLYLAYGANLNRDSMSWRCPGARPVRAMMLQGWSLEFHVHATIRPDAQGQVPVGIWEITPECESSLDRFEGYPTYYHKHYIDVDGEPCMVYVMAPRDPEPPSAGYLRTIAEGYQHWDLPLDLLWEAVDYTEEITNDLYWSATRVTDSTTGMDVVQPGLVPGHDSGHVRDLEHTH